MPTHPKTRQGGRMMTLTAIKDLWMQWRLSGLMLACLILGGTSQAVWGFKTILYVISILVIAQVLTEKDRKSLKAVMSTPFLLGAAFCILIGLYIMPLPPGLWTGLAGRDIIVNGFDIAGLDTADGGLPWMPMSLTPEKTLKALFAFLPLVAVACVLGLSARRREIKASQMTLIGFAIFTVLLGTAQAFTKMDIFYLYERTNIGLPVGFFSNPNHQACFLAMIIPIAWYRARRALEGTSRAMISVEDISFSAVISVLCIILASAGIVMTGSVAGYILLVIAIIGSVLIGMRQTQIRWVALMIGSVLFVLTLDFLFFGGYLVDAVSALTSQSELSRSTILKTSMQIQDSFGVMGIGPGAFEDSYKLFENRERLRSTYVNEAHNDYLQIWLELGYVGLILVIGAVIWFVKCCYDNLRNLKTGRRLPLVFCLVALMPILHSVVDYPLRNIALGALLTYAIVIMTDSQETR